MEFSQYLNLIENKLQSNFDKNDDFNIDGYTYDLFAEYHQRSERFFLTKKATIFGIENNEYVLIKHFENIDKIILDNYIYNLIKSVDSVVKPHDDHMSSIITGIIVLDNKITSKNNLIIDIVKKFKYHKGFSFGFKGWVDIRLLIVFLKDNYMLTNKKGEEVVTVYSIIK